MSKAQRKKTEHSPNDAVLPLTRERESQGHVERLMTRDGSRAATTMDEAGLPSRPYRVVNIVLSFERRGRISAEAADAGYRFKDDFDLGCLMELRAADYASPVVQGKRRADIGISALRSRDRVYAALKAVGGSTSLPGSCLWHVVGLDMSLREWALLMGVHDRRLSEEAASGVFLSAIDSLAAHYRNTDSTPRKASYYRVPEKTA